MMINKKNPELLSPAGSFEALKAAVFAGADAVYLGGTQFNARMNAKNFSREDLVRAVNFCHMRGVRVYVTVNTLIYDRQMNQALEYVGFLAGAGVDALIVADIGLAVNIKKFYPEMRIHASTQCSGHNSEAAEYLSQIGFARMVCARELTENNIKLLCGHSEIEIEAFVHGALCVSQSGQCLMSSFIGGRSGNRGECAQPCRMMYNGKYLLSLKDNCLACHIKELISCGVSSLKIEGRMKSPDYVYSTVSLYRKLLDEQRNAGADEIKRLTAVFSRQGFTDGYFTGNLGENMLGIRTQDDKSLSAVTHINITDIAPERKPIETPGISVTGKISVDFPKSDMGKRTWTARFYNSDSIHDELKKYFDIIYLPLDRFDGKKANGVVLPPVITESEAESVIASLEKAVREGAVHALVGNVGHIKFAQNAGLILHGDYRLNIYNSFSAKKYLDDFEDIILSPELILPQIRDIKVKRSVIIYGKLPLMTLERQLKCDSLRDRKGVVFPVRREGGRDIVFNAYPIYMADYSERCENADINNMHFIFTDEGRQECLSVVKAYIRKLPTKKEIRRIK